MQVNFKSVQTLHGKKFAAGVQQVPDRFTHSMQFRALIKAGHAKMLPKTPAEQKMQANKDKLNQAHALELSQRASAPEGEAHTAAKGAFAIEQAKSPALKLAEAQATFTRQARTKK